MGHSKDYFMGLRAQEAHEEAILSQADEYWETTTTKKKQHFDAWGRKCDESEAFTKVEEPQAVFFEVGYNDDYGNWTPIKGYFSESEADKKHRELYNLKKWRNHKKLNLGIKVFYEKAA